MEKFQDQNIFDYEETEAGAEDDTMTGAVGPSEGATKKKDDKAEKPKLEVYKEKLVKFVNRLLKR